MNNMENLREQIERRLESNQVYYAHFVANGEPMKKIRTDTTNDILKLVEKRIDEMIEETHNNARRIPEDQPDYMYFRAKAIGMMQIKELLKQ